MADEKSPSNPSLPKKETVRITLPPRMTEAPSVKRETVRIAQNTPSDKGQTIRIQPPAPSGPGPKKETTKIVTLGATPPPPPSIGVPPAPPKPPGALSVPPPKPPVKAPGAPAAPAPAAPSGLKPSIPKKETARIQIPPPASKTPMPKATIKLQQTQPLPQAPAASVVKTSTTTLAKTGPIVDSASEPMMLVASALVFAGSVLAAVLSAVTYFSAGV